ncbi:glycosyltransferase family 2 protein [Actinoplanes sp. NPDC049265]|uniref:glycosyltransferase family 2 protein n=1 Tax=Actinoplanes sp. NPDC049265 TaxID=3363902 RepID=UPI00371D9290
MSANPDVSVVIPTRFRPDLVVRAVRSALVQTHRDLEVIVVIDGPDDPTEKALAALGDERLRVITLPGKGGAPNARNQGAQAARGAWVAYLDDDDEWLPAKLEVQLAAAAASTAALPVVASRLINRTPRADSIMPRRLPEAGEPISEYLTKRRGLFYGDGFIQTSTIMAPAELFRRVPFTVGLRRQQELDWTLRALQQEGAELVFASEPLVLWHQDEDRDRISLHAPWREQLDWLRRNQTLFTPRAYAAFTMSVLSSMAATTRSLAVCREILAEARGYGRPGIIDYVTFLQIWALPPGMRSQLRDRVLGRTAAPKKVPAQASRSERVDVG